MRHLIESRDRGSVAIGGRNIVMLGSNDYLSLSTDPRVLAAARDAMDVYGSGLGLYPIYATTPVHAELAESLADFLGTQAAALFSSGGSANSGVLTTLVGEGDVIFSDRLNHASIIDGCRLSRADVVPYGNRDVADLRSKLEMWPDAKRRLIVTDGIFSMEGGAAPLPQIHALAQEFGAILMIDEAHATAVVGPKGRGTGPLLGLPNDAPGIVLTGSLSKALGGASGGFAAASHDVVEELQSRSRSWIFTMGMTTANAATALAALKICRENEEPLDRLRENVAILRDAFASKGLECLDSDSAITAVVVGETQRAIDCTRALFASGVYVPAISYPVVAKGAARLRFQASAGHERSQLLMAADSLARYLEAAG